MLPHRSIESRLQAAVSAALPGANTAGVLVRPCPDPKFGDYQTNALMALAKERKMNPRQLAADVVAKLDVSEWCEPVEIAGAGFLNFRLKTGAIVSALESARNADLFFAKAEKPKTIVIDFSSPNVAKPMHIGHIRSTVLGDALARVLRLLGHRVITDNHIGDWGTQFGKLLVGWKTILNAEALKADPMAEMERMYKTINAAGEADAAVLERAREELVKLQDGDEENLALWREMIRLSEAHFATIYQRLGVQFDHTYGESFYNPRLKNVVRELSEKGIAKESDGAVAVFSDGSMPPKLDPFLKQKDGEWVPNPCLIQKSDGAANYATTDLATLEFRIETWQPDDIAYVTDGRQQLHFQQIFATFRRWKPEQKVKLEHVWFGSILGEDGTPLKTRSGDPVRLSDVLDEAEKRAFDIVTEKSPEIPEEQRRVIARVISQGGVKYVDLLPNRQSDYTFSWERMLSLQGNTAPYIQYGYARICSIYRKGGIEKAGLESGGGLKLSHPDELKLARHLLNLDFVLHAMAEEYRPNYLCNYLYELAGHFSRFFENCPVLKSEEPERGSRLVLCDMTARVLKLGLGVLGIDVLEQM